MRRSSIFVCSHLWRRVELVDLEVFGSHGLLRRQNLQGAYTQKGHADSLPVSLSKWLKELVAGAGFEPATFGL